MGEQVEVEAARRHVGGDEQFGGTRAHPAHHPVALFLAHAAVQRFGPVPALAEQFGEFVDLGAGAAEHDGCSRHLDVEQAAERRRLVDAGDHVGALADEAGPGLARGAPHAHGDRLMLMACGDGIDTRRQRGREQHGLAGRRCGRQQFVDVFGEAHVEHLVGFVEHDGLDRVERQRAATQVVERTAGGGDDDMGATLEQAQLPTDRLAAVHGDDPRAEGASVGGHRLGHLDGQFAGGHQHECHRGACGAAVESFEDGQGECGGLAGAGGSLAEHVAPGEHGRDGFALDGSGFFVAEGHQGVEQFRAQAERTETTSILSEAAQLFAEVRVHDLCRVSLSGSAATRAGQPPRPGCRPASARCRRTTARRTQP